MSKIPFGEQRFELDHGCSQLCSCRGPIPLPIPLRDYEVSSEGQWKVEGSQQEKLFQAVARTYTHDMNAHKRVDADIALAAYIEVCDVLGLTP